MVSIVSVFEAPNGSDAESCKIAVDNIRVSSLVYAPTVVGIGDAQQPHLILSIVLQSRFGYIFRMNSTQTI